jgi:hypothetical protein
MTCSNSKATGKGLSGSYRNDTAWVKRKPNDRRKNFVAIITGINGSLAQGAGIDGQ